MKLTFFSSTHLAPKYFKVVANANNLVAIFLKQNIFNVVQDGTSSIIPYLLTNSFGNYDNDHNDYDNNKL